jgi:hypothetical protein
MVNRIVPLTGSDTSLGQSQLAERAQSPFFGDFNLG